MKRYIIRWENIFSIIFYKVVRKQNQTRTRISIHDTTNSSPNQCSISSRAFFKQSEKISRVLSLSL